jgi:hypothetical protein
LQRPRNPKPKPFHVYHQWFVLRILEMLDWKKRIESCICKVICETIAAFFFPRMFSCVLIFVVQTMKETIPTLATMFHDTVCVCVCMCVYVCVCVCMCVYVYVPHTMWHGGPSSDGPFSYSFGGKEEDSHTLPCFRFLVFLFLFLFLLLLL